MQLIRDISDSSSFWGAAWVFGCFPDVHIICDAPIGCYNLLGVAVTNYTDALANMKNLTPTSIREEDVIHGTADSLKRTVDDLRSQGTLEGKHLIVVSSGESEMVSADHGTYLATLDPDARFFWSRSLEQDEWTGRNRALVFAWEQYGKPAATQTPPRPRAVNIIGPSLGCFNSPADLHEVKRLVAGAGGEINLVYPFEASIADTPRLSQAAVNVVLHRESGEPLAQELGRPYMFAPFGVKGTTHFLRELADMLGTREQAEAFIAQEKRGTLKVVWDMWKGPQSDWFAFVDYAAVAGRSYIEGLRAFLVGELGLKEVWSSGQPRAADEPDNIEIRKRLHERAPAFVFGSINEKIYLAEANAKAAFHIPAAFPGPVVRRTYGTPFMGYAGAAHLMQELVNRFYETVFNFLPVETIDSTASKGPQAQAVPWTSEAAERLQSAMENVPYLARISANRALRQAAEELARAAGAAEVTLEMVEQALQGEH
jgi:chlorophyllide a reductase subunit Z